MLAKSVTKNVDIQASPKKVFLFISNPLNWPQYAIVNLKSARKGAEEGWYEIESIHGTGFVKTLANEEHGILDHIWKDPNAGWTVFVRVVPNGNGSTLTNTFFIPAHYDDQAFEKAMEGIEKELAVLKKILEA
ncbi:SRPBCC family protein [Candidatus Protochlamydia phocaeensis]|uniref:SRPBCC family protein n=1 Tax=Candidatus Protochlamydia phocaeensis TaxID=1414722 RepID=UPI0008382651|nr:SRPBCC family protein [Candidatus Protochlamydia phocaeensis]